ncbi:MAG TPA: tripartite tricarboxylate transporter TctB family protein [Pseudolabrys sp.]|jgi:hypothetical protein|nr:tripartite tricarboxylate transporter TctB family protein [Pseudolabrys sp.]
MSENVHEGAGSGPSHRSVEIGVAVAMAVLALIAIYGSLQNGVGWGSDGPRAGFFPFYVALIVLFSCVMNLATVIRRMDKTKLFADWGQLRQVFSVIVPTAVYVGLVPYIGIYVSSALLIAVFMRWFGRYNWPLVAFIAIVVPVLTFITFEIWFLVPLPKGPLENWLGY